MRYFLHAYPMVWVLGWHLCCVGSLQAEEKNIVVLLEGGTSSAFGFDHLGDEEHGPFSLGIILQGNLGAGWSVNWSRCNDYSGDYLWNPDEIEGVNSIHCYQVTGVDAELRHAAIFEGTLVHSGGSGGWGGPGAVPEFDLHVNEIDIDVDATNAYTYEEGVRVPLPISDSEKGAEDEREYLGDDPPSTALSGMTMGASEGWARIDIRVFIKKPATLSIVTSDWVNFEFSADGSTVLPSSYYIVAPEHFSGAAEVSRYLYIRPKSSTAQAGCQAIITGIITPDDNSGEAVDRVSVNYGALVITALLPSRAPRP